MHTCSALSLLHVFEHCMCMYTDVYKPSRYYLGQFSAILLTFSTSALLHVSLHVHDSHSHVTGSCVNTQS